LLNIIQLAIALQRRRQKAARAGAR